MAIILIVDSLPREKIHYFMLVSWAHCLAKSRCWPCPFRVIPPISEVIVFLKRRQGGWAGLVVGPIPSSCLVWPEDLVAWDSKIQFGLLRLQDPVWSSGLLTLCYLVPTLTTWFFAAKLALDIKVLGPTSTHFLWFDSYIWSPDWQ
jgi:hypothetical protein